MEPLETRNVRWVWNASFVAIGGWFGVTRFPRLFGRGKENASEMKWRWFGVPAMLAGNFHFHGETQAENIKNFFQASEGGVAVF